MRTSFLPAALVAVSLGTFPSVARAQQAGPGAPERTHFGVQLSYGNDSEFGVGGRVRYSLRGLFPTVPLSAIGSADVFFPGNSVTWVEGNYNVVYNFSIPTAPRVAPYAGGGLNFVYRDAPGGSDGKFGLNLVAGMGFRSSGPVMPFLEIRGVISGGEQFLVSGGIMF